MNKHQLRELIQEILRYLEPEIPYANEVPVELLMLTAAKESWLGEYIKQLGTGPALGIFQMEPRTEGCMWKNWLKGSRTPLANKLHALKDNVEATNDLKTNLAYQIGMARAHYFRAPFPLHKKVCVLWMAKVWKKYYNTTFGKGTEQEAIDAYNKLCI